MLTDLSLAESFDIATPNEVRFVSRGRSGPSLTDQIHFRTVGSTKFDLQRSINGQEFQTVASNLGFFSFDYQPHVNPGTTAVLQESAEQLIYEYGDAGTTNSQYFTTSFSNRAATWFKPLLDPRAVHWKCTRVEFVAKRNGSTLGSFYIRLEEANPQNLSPSGTALSSSFVFTNTLPTTATWVSNDIPDASQLSVEKGYCLTFSPTTLAFYYPIIGYIEGVANMPSRSHWTTTSDSGSTWTAASDTAELNFRIYGTQTINTGAWP
jgi:hypothetical protein